MPDVSSPAGEELLDGLQRAAFGYFLQAVNPGNGLVADTSRDGSPASIAVVGFALSAHPVAVEERTGRVLGATIVARHAGEMIDGITLAMVAGIGLRTLAQAIHAYPTQAEAIRKAADAYTARVSRLTIRSLLRRWLA